MTGDASDDRTRREHNQHLRTAAPTQGRLMAHHFGLTHAGVNVELTATWDSQRRPSSDCGAGSTRHSCGCDRHRLGESADRRHPAVGGPPHR